MCGSLRTLVVACGVMAGVLLTGCSSDNKDGQSAESKKTATGLKDTRSELVKAKKEVNDAIVALDKLSAGGNVQQSYKEYTTAVKDVKAAGDKARTRAQAMRENSRAYVAKWEKEMDNVTNPELRAGAMERRNRVKANYDEILEVGRSVRDAYQPFLKDLQDIQKALASDLTPAGVSSANLAMGKAKTEGTTLNERIDALIAKLDEVASGGTTSAPAGAASAAQPGAPTVPGAAAPTPPAQ
jgi:hypothetical protein